MSNLNDLPSPVDVLSRIADGLTYEQICRELGITYLELFGTVKEALRQLKGIEPTENGIEKPKKAHPRAYELWTPEEEAQLRDLWQKGTKVADIAKVLQRQNGAVRSRLVKMGLVESGSFISG